MISHKLKPPTIPVPPLVENPSSVPGAVSERYSYSDSRHSDGLRGRGGSAPPDNPESAEQYELGDYRNIQEHKDADDGEYRREAKREKKRQWLETQDEMKFSHSLQFNAVPDWSSHYIAYSNLKKLCVIPSWCSGLNALALTTCLQNIPTREVGPSIEIRRWRIETAHQ